MFSVFNESGTKFFTTDQLLFIFGRRSIRVYTPGKVSESTITKLLQAAMAAPSAVSKDPWRFVVAQKPETLAKRIWERLREGRFTGGYTVVKDAVRELTQKTQEVFVPLLHRPGEAQVDFGHALANVNGQLAGSLAWPMRFVAGKKAPRDSGNQELEKNGVAASGIR